MSEPYLGEIRMFAGNFAPRTNAYCSGQLLPINQNQSLFSLLGTQYGGDGRTTFALPDLRGRLPICFGQGPGLSDYRIGQTGGTELVTLTMTELPSHTHTPVASKDDAGTQAPHDMIPAVLQSPFTGFYVPDDKRTGTPLQMDKAAVQFTGGGQSHENRMPALAISIIIALQGIFPSRN